MNGLGQLGELLKDPKYRIYGNQETKKVYKDPKDRLSEAKYAFENGILMLIGKEFGGKAAGFDVRWEARKFRPSQIDHPFLKDLKAQTEGKAEKVAEIYFDRKYLCDVTESMQPNQAIAIIQKALYERILKTA